MNRPVLQRPIPLKPLAERRAVPRPVSTPANSVDRRIALVDLPAFFAWLADKPEVDVDAIEKVSPLPDLKKTVAEALRAAGARVAPPPPQTVMRREIPLEVLAESAPSPRLAVSRFLRSPLNQRAALDDPELDAACTRRVPRPVEAVDEDAEKLPPNPLDSLRAFPLGNVRSPEAAPVALTPVAATPPVQSPPAAEAPRVAPPDERAYALLRFGLAALHGQAAPPAPVAAAPAKVQPPPPAATIDRPPASVSSGFALGDVLPREPAIALSPPAAEVITPSIAPPVELPAEPATSEIAEMAPTQAVLPDAPPAESALLDAAILPPDLSTQAAEPTVALPPRALPPPLAVTRRSPPPKLTLADDFLPSRDGPV